MKKAFLMTTATLVLAACATSSQNGTSSTNIAGMYYANLPCSQTCSSFIVDLALEPDNTYSMVSHPKDDPTEQYESGTWAIKGNSLELTKSTEQAASQNFSNIDIKKLTVTTESKLILLNANGKPYATDTPRYIFEKK
ncbi:MAG: copper resistance protein NlpE N-terminal domain-containing protein [Gammaproteobacteria bacterium]|nr:copper resistance protein NlpE N-terminal domain-containing protein [Gammaproteobacteria bacterium]